MTTGNSLDGDGATTPLSVALSTDTGQGATFGSDGKLYVNTSALSAAIAANATDITALETEQTTQNTNITANATDITALEAEQLTQNTTIASNTTAGTANAAAAAANAAAIAALQGKGELLGVWNANTNSPNINTGTYTDNSIYYVGTSGTTAVNGAVQRGTLVMLSFA